MFLFDVLHPKSPVTDNTQANNADLTKVMTLVKAIYNRGGHKEDITAAVAVAIAQAKHDKVGQEA